MESSLLYMQIMMKSYIGSPCQKDAWRARHVSKISNKSAAVAMTDSSINKKFCGFAESLVGVRTKEKEKND